MFVTRVIAATVTTFVGGTKKAASVVELESSVGLATDAHTPAQVPHLRGVESGAESDEPLSLPSSAQHGDATESLGSGVPSDS